MQNKKTTKPELTKAEKDALRAFLDCPIPRKYHELDARGHERFDFMYNYEEVFDYADSLLRGETVDLGCNFIEMKSAAVNDEFRNILPVLARRDPAMEDFCDKFGRAISIVVRHAR